MTIVSKKNSRKYTEVELSVQKYRTTWVDINDHVFAVNLAKKEVSEVDNSDDVGLNIQANVVLKLSDDSVVFEIVEEQEFPFTLNIITRKDECKIKLMGYGVVDKWIDFLSEVAEEVF